MSGEGKEAKLEQEEEEEEEDPVYLEELNWSPDEIEEYVDFKVDNLVSEALERERRDLLDAMQDAMLAGARGCKTLPILVAFAEELEVSPSDPLMMTARQIEARALQPKHIHSHHYVCFYT